MDFYQYIVFALQILQWICDLAGIDYDFSDLIAQFTKDESSAA